MKKIIAIGGGEIGRRETAEIDRQIIKLSGKKRPKFLFMPTASLDNGGYIRTVNDYFGKRLGCLVDVLYLVNRKVSRREIKDKILKADIIYVGGGNTLKMMIIWRRLGVDKFLKEAYKKGIVLSGLSAGAACWFKYCLSDSRKFSNRNAPYIKVKGLGFINGLVCPHYDSEPDRKSALKKMMEKEKMFAVALDDCAALEAIDNKFRILTSKKKANGYKVYWRAGKYYEEKMKN